MARIQSTIEHGKRATVRDVAALAGVHHASVSVALNSAKSGTGLSVATRERIVEAAKRLNYSPNITSRFLLGKRNNTLGLALGGAHNPFYIHVAREVERAAASLGYRTFTIHQPTLSASLADVEIWPVDGIFVWTTNREYSPTKHLERLRNTPLIYLGYQTDDDSEHIGYNLADGTRQAVAHLLSRGYRRIAYASPRTDRERSVPDTRWTTFVQICRERKIEALHLELDEGHGPRQEAGFHAGQELAKLDRNSRPDALVVAGDATAIGLYQGARRAGLRIPEDVAIVGFDGIPESQFLDKPLTTVLCPLPPFAEAAAKLMADRLSDTEGSPAKQILIPVSLIIGETT